MISRHGCTALILLAVVAYCHIDTRAILAGEASSSSVTVVGSFSNMRFTEEHAYGYTVELWQMSDKVLGFFLASDGLQGDTPTAILENVQLDSATGKLEFKARIAVLTADLVKEGGQFKQVNRCYGRVFEFHGQLSKDRKKLSGKLTWKTEDARETVSKESVELLPVEDALMNDFINYAEWKAYADPILKFRGPKC